ncbi:hypothetical protein Tco_1000489 [Tanacetum coccineum]
MVYVDDIIFGLTNKELCTGFEKLMKDNQDKYVAEILKKFNYFIVKSISTLVDLEKPLVKDRDVDDVDIHIYRSMIGSLMYLTASRPDIMFACKKQTVVATSTTEAEYVATASCCGQLLWIQNQLLDYAYNFMNTVINIDNNNLLTKGFDAGKGFQYMDSSIGMLYNILMSTSIYAKHIEYRMLTPSPAEVMHVKRGRDTKIPQSSGPPIKVGDEAVDKELGDRMERVSHLLLYYLEA